MIFLKVQLDFHHYHIPNYLPPPLEPHQQLDSLPYTENKLLGHLPLQCHLEYPLRFLSLSFSSSLFMSLAA